MIKLNLCLGWINDECILHLKLRTLSNYWRGWLYSFEWNKYKNEMSILSRKLIKRESSQDRQVSHWARILIFLHGDIVVKADFNTPSSLENFYSHPPEHNLVDVLILFLFPYKQEVYFFKTKMHLEMHLSAQPPKVIPF